MTNLETIPDSETVHPKEEVENTDNTEAAVAEPEEEEEEEEVPVVPNEDSINNTESNNHDKEEVQTVGQKRNLEDSSIVDNTTVSRSDDAKGEADTASPSPIKRAKIAHPPAVSSLLVDVEEYTLDAPPTAENTDDARIDTPSLILFGLHPLVKEPPLRKMCEKYGEIISMGVRSAFASRYGHVEFASVEQAKDAYRALNGATLLHKPLLVQPTKSEAAAANSA